jgi:hypothetical protein
MTASDHVFVRWMRRGSPPVIPVPAMPSAARQRLRNSIVGKIRGEGRPMRIEFVADCSAKLPFPAEKQIQQRILATASKRDRPIRAESGAVDSMRGDRLLLTPLIASLHGTAGHFRLTGCHH